MLELFLPSSVAPSPLLRTERCISPLHPTLLLKARRTPGGMKTIALRFSALALLISSRMS